MFCRWGTSVRNKPSAAPRRTEVSWTPYTPTSRNNKRSEFPVCPAKIFVVSFEYLYNWAKWHNFDIYCLLYCIIMYRWWASSWFPTVWVCSPCELQGAPPGRGCLADISTDLDRRSLWLPSPHQNLSNNNVDRWAAAPLTRLLCLFRVHANCFK